MVRICGGVMAPAEFVRELRVLITCWSGRSDPIALAEVKGMVEVAREVARSGEVNGLQLLRLRRYRRRALRYGRCLCDN
jgi:hypothetical protein